MSRHCRSLWLGAVLDSLKEEVAFAGAASGAHGVGYAAAFFDDLFVAAGGFFVPLPCVFEGCDLGGGAGAVFFGEEDVVVLAGVEGQVEVDEVDGVIGDIVAEDFEVVALVEPIFVVVRYQRYPG